MKHKYWQLCVAFWTFCSIFSVNSYAFGNKVIYGDDDRRDVYDSVDDVAKRLAESTTAMIPKNRIADEDDEHVKILGATLGEEANLCKDEKFYNQPSAAACSGFLVGPDLLMTAGHCIRNKNDCHENAWVFQYSMKGPNQTPIVKKGDVYSCKKIMSTVLTEDIDYAVIKLDRIAQDRLPLMLRKEGEILEKTPVFVIGHPSGVPTKIADKAFVRDSKPDAGYFVANLDTFGGNSGSAVFNAKSGLVEGILVRGEDDYEMDAEANCRRSRHCPDDGCRGEDVTKITSVRVLAKIIDYNKTYFEKYPKLEAGVKSRYAKIAKK